MSPRATDAGHEKARIRTFDERGLVSDVFAVDFNPAEVSIDKSVTYGEQDILGLDAPIQQFVSGDAATLSATLRFDVYEREEDDVRELTDRFAELVLVDGDLHAPPLVQFAWGSITFTSVVESVNTTFTMFARDGTPVRARADVTFKEYTPPSKQLQGEPRFSADKTTVHRVTEGETLPSIAAEEYGDPARWRPIAEANDVVNPRRLEAGAELTIPPAEGGR